MIYESSIRAIGNSQGTTIPKTALERLRVREGDRVYLVETPDGLLLTPHDPQFQQAVESAREIAARYRDALRELADQ